MQASTPLPLRHASITSTGPVSERASGSTDAPASPRLNDEAVLQGVRNRRVFDPCDNRSARLPLDSSHTYRGFHGGLDLCGDTHHDIAGYGSDSDALEDIFSRHAEERNAQGRFPKLRAGFLRAASLIRPAPHDGNHLSTAPVTLLNYRPRSLSELSVLPQNDVAVAGASGTNSDGLSTAVDADTDQSDTSTESETEIASTSSETSRAGRASQPRAPGSEQSGPLAPSAQDRNQKIVKKTAQYAADTGEPPSSQFHITAQRDFFMTLLSSKNRNLVKHHPENNFERGFHYLMPTLCTLADDFGVDRAAIAARANQFTNFAFRPEGDTLLGISKPDLRTSLERKLHLPKTNAARRTPDHLDAVKSLMRLIDKKMETHKVDSDQDASTEPSDDHTNPLIGLTDRLTWALMLTKHKLLSEVAKHEQHTEGNSSPASTDDLRELERKFRDVKRLVPFTENNRRSIISVMQQRAKLIHSAISFANARVHPQGNPQQDGSGDVDAAGTSRPPSRAASPVHVHQQYRIPGWTFSEQTRDRVLESDSEESASDSESVLTVSSTGHDEQADSPDLDVWPETLAAPNRWRSYRAFADEASVDSSLRL